MAKQFHKYLRNFALRNAPTSSGPSSRGVGTINRDPKVLKIKKLGYELIAGGGAGGRDNFEAPDVDFETIDNAIQRDSYVAQSMMKYSELIFKNGYQLKWKNEQAYSYLQVRLDMMAAATSIPTEILFQGIADDLVRYSNCFLVKARAKKGVGLPPGVPITPILPSKEAIAGYFRLAPKTITISREANGTILGYRQETGSGDPIDFKPEDIVHLTLNHGVGKAFGDPWITSVLEDIRLLRKIEENVAILLYRHIFPLLVYKIGKAEAGQEATEEEMETAQQNIGSIPADGGIVVPERHDIDTVKMNSIDVKEYLDYFEQRAFTGLGMSQVDMGRGDTANKNTADAMTGMKVDRIKGWHRIIESQIDKNMIDELLIEGGFDPLINSDFDVNFIFNEIENEKKISLENHAMAQWNSDLATFEETRSAMGYDPIADEARLRFQMVGIATANSEAEIANKNQPENQNGKKNAPKESVEHHLVEHQVRESEFTPVFQDIFSDVRESAFRDIQSSKDTRNFQIGLQLQEKKFQRLIDQHVLKSLQQGSIKYQKETDSVRKIKANLKKGVVIDYANDWFTSFQQGLSNDIGSVLSQETEATIKISLIQSKIERYEKRSALFLSYITEKSTQYGYLLAAIAAYENKIVIQSDHGCAYCEEMSGKIIDLSKLTDYEEKALFYSIPPWHGNCKCSLRGGE